MLIGLVISLVGSGLQGRTQKKYFANQENINKYSFTNQKDTFLDVEYAEFQKLEIPEVLKQLKFLNLKTPLPSSDYVFY